MSSTEKRILRWISQLRHSIFISINNSPVTTIYQVKYIIMKSRYQNIKSIELILATTSPVIIHPQTSLHQIHLDQLNVIAKSYHHARFDGHHPSISLLRDHNVDPRIFSTKNLPGYPTQITRKFLLCHKEWPA